MNSQTRQYLFALIFIGVGIFQLVNRDYLEFSLYALAGATFILNALAIEPKLAKHKKTLSIITWIFIIATGILFLYVLQHEYL